MKARKKPKTLTDKQITKLTPQQIGKYSSEVLFHTYQKMRDKALKRLSRLQQAGYSERQTYQQNYEDIARKPSTMSESEIKQGIIELRAFFTNPLSTVRGQKKADAVQKAQQEVIFKKDWIESLSDEDLELYGDFMDTLRTTSSFYLVYDDNALNELWSIYRMSPNITNFQDDPLTANAYQRFLDRQTTVPLHSTKKSTETKTSESERMKTIKKRKSKQERKRKNEAKRKTDKPKRKKPRE